MFTHTFPGLGSYFTITLWDSLTPEVYAEDMRAVEAYVQDFERTYSRFISTSLVTTLSTQTGTFTVPRECTAMLRLYQAVSAPTQGKITPAIGATLSDLGYDATYSFTERTVIRKAPPIEEILTIVDDTHITLHTPILLDFGALGKGYVVDHIFEQLRAAGRLRFLVNGSGDIRYTSAPAVPIVCGLEHPLDTSLAIGTLSLTEGALCASATNRRTWGVGKHHYVDPATGTSPTAVCATWVYAANATVADLIASALFFTAPEQLTAFSFEYLIINKHLQQKRSAGFPAELFSDTIE